MYLRLIGWMVMVKAQSVLASQWYWQPHFSVATEYNDNPLLSNTLITETSSAVTQAGFNVGVRDQSRMLQLSPRFRSSDYSDDALALDRDDGYLDVKSRINTLRSEFRIDLSYADESTRTSELFDTGQLQVRIPVTRLTVRPAWDYLVSQNNTLRISASNQRTEYDEGELNGLFDYHYDQLGVVWEQQRGGAARAINTIYAGVFWSEYDVGSVASFFIANRSQTQGVHLGYTHYYTPFLSFNVQIGMRETDFTFNLSGQALTTEDRGETLSVSAKQVFAKSQLTATAMRSIIPSSAGTLSERDEVVGRYRYDLSSGLSLQCSFRWFENRFLQDFVTALREEQRQYEAFDVGLNWHFSPVWSLHSSVRVNAQQYDDNESTDSTRVLLSLRYTGLQQSIAR